ADVDAAGVDQDELAAAPLADGLGAVAGDAGGLVHDRLAAGREAVDEGGLAGVGESDDGHAAGQPTRLGLGRAPGPPSVRHPPAPYSRRISSISWSAVSR